jgi:SRSO17 transposase
MQARKKNMERMAEVVPGSNDQALQHFLSNSNWSGRAVMDQVALEANKLLGGTTDSALLIDESGFAKKGEKSVEADGGRTACQVCGSCGSCDISRSAPSLFQLRPDQACLVQQ